MAVSSATQLCDQVSFLVYRAQLYRTTVVKNTKSKTTTRFSNYNDTIASRFERISSTKTAYVVGVFVYRNSSVLPRETTSSMIHTSQTPYRIVTIGTNMIRASNVTIQTSYPYCFHTDTIVKTDLRYYPSRLSFINVQTHAVLAKHCHPKWVRTDYVGTDTYHNGTFERKLSI